MNSIRWASTTVHFRIVTIQLGHIASLPSRQQLNSRTKTDQFCCPTIIDSMIWMGRMLGVDLSSVRMVEATSFKASPSFNNSWVPYRSTNHRTFTKEWTNIRTRSWDSLSLLRSPFISHKCHSFKRAKVTSMLTVALGAVHNQHIVETKTQLSKVTWQQNQIIQVARLVASVMITGVDSVSMVPTASISISGGPRRTLKHYDFPSGTSRRSRVCSRRGTLQTISWC